MIKGIEFSEAQQEVIDLLKDGNFRRTSELVAFLDDTQANPKALQDRVYKIRKKLIGTDYGIVCEYICGVYGYRLVKKAHSEAQFAS